MIDIGSAACVNDQSSAALATHPNSRAMGPLSADHAHGDPMHMCVANAGTTMAQRFVNDGFAV